MISIIEDNRAEIEALCREHDVAALWVFGSAVKGTWDPDTSDVDFLVDLGEYEPGVAGRFLGLLVALERLLGRSVDLLTVRQVKSDWFRIEVMTTRVKIYASTESSVVA